jgi:hypothetical protein
MSFPKTRTPIQDESPASDQVRSDFLRLEFGEQNSAEAAAK